MDATPVTDMDAIRRARAAQTDEFDNIDFVTPDAPAAPELVLFNPSIKLVDTFRFKLNQASMMSRAAGGSDVYALVRLVNLTDRVMTNEVATNVDQLIRKLFFSGSRQDQRKTNSSQEEMAAVQRRTREVAHAFACTGFVNPKLVLTREEVVTGVNMCVEDVPLADLSEFVRLCEGNEELAASRLSTFPE